VTSHALSQSSQPPSFTKPVLKQRKTQLFFASCTLEATELPVNRPLGLEKDVLETSGAGVWLRLLCPECLLSHFVASVVRYITEWSRNNWAQFPSKNRTKVQFDMEVRQCIALNSTTTHNATQGDEYSLPNNSPLKDSFHVPGGYYSFMDNSLFCDKRQGQTIKPLPSTELKSSHAPIEPRGGANDANIEDDIFFI
jgi:hypothetical protein